MCHRFEDIQERQLGRFPCPLNSIHHGSLTLHEENLNTLQSQLSAESYPEKVNLESGVCRDEDGGPFVFPWVKHVWCMEHVIALKTSD